MSEPRWRVGRTLGRTLYLDGECIGMVDTPALAKVIVDVMNADITPPAPVAACTGIAASWCPVHGDCRCPVKYDGERTLDDAMCPLHASDSQHAEAPPVEAK